MTDDYQLFAQPVDGDEPMPPDVALITAYLARELSLVQIVAVEERLDHDAEFRAVVQPIIDAWALGGVLATSGPPVERPTATRVTRADLDAGWARHAAAPAPIAQSAPARRSHIAESVVDAGKTSSLWRIAAVIAMIVLPAIVAAQLVLYALRHPGTPGHDAARALVPASLRPVGDAQQPQALTLATQAIPVLDLSAPTAKTTTLGGVLGLREAPDGRVLVNDAGWRQLRLFESDLKASTVVRDSIPGATTSYGYRPWPLIPFRGDSSLFADNDAARTRAGTALVLDAHGQVARAAALVDIGFPELTRGTSGVDAKGRLVYKFQPAVKVGYAPMTAAIFAIIATPSGGAAAGRGGDAGGLPMVSAPITDRPDSLPIHRVDLETRRIDTAGYVVQPLDEKNVLVTGKNGVGDSLKLVLNPLPTIDEWAVLSDGTIAIVRGHDYHVDWILPDGTTRSSPKLPFAWKAITDADKQHLIDSTRQIMDSIDVLTRTRSGRAGNPAAPPPGRGGRSGTFGAGVGADGSLPVRRLYPFEVVPPSQIADYWPPLRAGAAMPDRDGNLWILPRTSTNSKSGELVYDVVNPERGLYRRVRVPLGRTIAGFGKGGVVYLQAGDVKNGFVLERTVVPR